MATQLTAGLKVYYPNGSDDVYGYGTVTAASGDGATVAPLDGSASVNIKAKEALPYSLSAEKGAQDMVGLDVLHDASILHNLKVRSSQDEYYTFVGSILVAVNPFTRLPIYEEDAVDRYKKADPTQPQVPHIYAVASSAYQFMSRYNRSQSVIISGESGAGKTETTKYVLRYMTSVSGSGGGGDVVSKKVMDSNPILEAFGNAKTVRNNNSSRFGKFMQIQFDQSHTIIGGEITQYLLEKSRVVGQNEGERNYHIFYQLCAGASDSDREKYKIGQAKDYHYLSQSGVFDAGMDDNAEFQLVKNAYDTIGLEVVEVDAIFRILSSVLALGNVEFTPQGDDKVSVKNPGVCEVVADLMQCPADTLKEAFEVRTMSTARAGRGSIYKVALKPQEAVDARDALAKSFYGRLFLWLVQRVSDNMKSDKNVTSTIGVLDIFGFESFKVNSFEQLCINYTNERLHQQFIDYVFKLEMQEYEREGINIKIPFNDNQLVLDLVEKRGGVLAILHENCQLKQGTDKTFVEKLHQDLAKTKHFEVPKREREAFVIEHYAGAVKYNSEGFLDKNKDALHDDLKMITGLCSLGSFKAIFPDEEESTNARGPKKLKTIATEFQKQLMSLVKTLGGTQPHYVKCIKPNDAKVPREFDSKKVRDQLAYSGVLETIQIRKVAYSVRMDHGTFVSRFYVCAQGCTGASPADQVVSGLGLDKNSDYLIGKSKVFLKSEKVLFALEKMREKALEKQISIIQRNARAFVYRKRYQRLKAAVIAARQLAAYGVAGLGLRKMHDERQRRIDQAIAAAAAAATTDEEKKAVEDAAIKNEKVVVRRASQMMGGSKGLGLGGGGPGLTRQASRIIREDDGPMEAVALSGWLQKEGQKGWKKYNWQRRWFMLKDGKLAYFTDQTCMDMKGALTLDPSCHASDLGRQASSKGVGEFHFQLASPERILKLAAERQEDMLMWIKGLNEAVRQLGHAASGGRMKISVFLPDGSCLDIAMNDTTTAKDVFMKVIQTIGVTRGLQYFALVEETAVEAGANATRVISESENVYNIFMRGEQAGTINRLVFKKVVFVDEDARPDANVVVLNFQYSQAVSDVLKNFYLDEPDAIRLAAIQFRCQHGVLDEATHTKEALLEQLAGYLPVNLKADVEAKAEYLADSIVAQAFKLNDQTETQLKAEYITKSKVVPVYGASFYNVRQETVADYPENLVLAVNSTGLHLQDVDSRKVLTSFPYEQIVKWGRSASSFNVIKGPQGAGTQFNFQTPAGEEINKFMGIYVRMLVDRRTHKSS